MTEIQDTTLDTANRLAAHTAVDTWITEDTKVVGIGSGSSMVYAIQRIAQRYWENGELGKLICVPSSYEALQLILEYKLTLGDLDRNPTLDVTFDGADEVDEDLVLIKGGGGSMLLEKVVAFCSKNLVIISDHTKDSTRLGEHFFKGIPIEISPVAYIPIIRRIENMYGGQCELRLAKAKVGPIITDNGNFIIDWRFVIDRDYDWDQVNHNIKLIPGCLETGLFVKMAKVAYFAMYNGTVQIKKCKTDEFQNDE